MKVKTLKDLQQIADKGVKLLYPEKTKIMVGMGTCGLATGAGEVLEAISEEVEKQKLDVVISSTCCIGFCQKEPLVDILQPGRPRVSYSEVTPERARELIEALAKGKIQKEWVLAKIEEEEYLTEGKTWKYPQDKPPKELEEVPTYEQLPFYSKQRKIAMRNCGFINPENIEEYIARGGYRTSYKVLKELKPEEVIAEITKSGLRGRGGAGFPTGRKWDICHKAKGDVKYIICNGDEGDPGAYMDRSILEGDPHSVLEGMIIGAYAIGANEGYIYVRAEYPLAVKNVGIAIKQAEEHGLLGKNIFGSGFNFTIKMDRGAGAFVCGEETALIAALEGRVGEPRLRPPYPAQSGLWGKPTNINNVETWANVPAIMARGADWYTQYGTETSKGTKVFSLVGKIENTGLVEVPMGITLREIVYDVGGGIPNEKQFKAVQTGGPSGGCIPQQFLGLPIDYEQLAKVGAIMGSGGMIVMDEDTCMVDVAKYFVEFLKSESCGKCTSCRDGIERMHEILTDITEGRGREGDIELLEELCEAIRDTSLCALGGTAPNPVLTTIRYFRDEYEAHIQKKRCPAGVCKKLVIAPCRNACPAGIDVPRYVRLIGEGRASEALAVIYEKIPFPSICGYVCFHPCEAKCRRGEIEDPIAIRALKRFAAEQDGRWRGQIKKVAKSTGKRVAIIGSGPAGLTAGYYLAKLGHAVTVFEALSQLGGMMRTGIPDYRLPKNILDKEIEQIKSTGVDMRVDAKVGSVDQLLKGGHDAVFVAIGAHQGITLGVEGEDSPGVMEGVSFLRSVNLGEKPKLGNRVAVIGGGNAAVDASRVALRLGAEEVTIVYRRSQREMPASKEEVEQALAEGVKIEFLATPSKITQEKGALKMECIRMKLGELDASGRQRPEPIPGSEFTIEIDNVIAAIGQTPENAAQLGLPVTNIGTLEVASDNLATSKEGVFAGGDAVSGPASVIEAIAAGRQAAISIDQYLGGDGMIEETLAPPEGVAELAEISEEEKPRVEIPLLQLDQRLRGFREVELGYTRAMAIEEAKRCLKCDLEE